MFFLTLSYELLKNTPPIFHVECSITVAAEQQLQRKAARFTSFRLINNPRTIEHPKQWLLACI